ncbi:putative transposase, partial [Neisseria meningitidis NM3144]
SIVYTDCYRSYDVLDVSEFSHFSFAETSFSYQSQHTFC